MATALSFAHSHASTGQATCRTNDGACHQSNENKKLWHSQHTTLACLLHRHCAVFTSSRNVSWCTRL